MQDGSNWFENFSQQVEEAGAYRRLHTMALISFRRNDTDRDRLGVRLQWR